MSRPCELSLVEILDLLASRELSARELVQSCLDRITAADAAVQAFVTLTPEPALAAAHRADEDRAAGRSVGPLAGVPVAVKDIYLTADAPTLAGSRVPVGHDPTVDAAVWNRLAAAGAGLLGKTTTHEFAFGTASEPTRNPWDLTRTPGGSSGGSAAAVAACMTPLATGTDTGGSLRIPAAACGISSLRPAHGRVSTYGIVPLSPTLDTAGVLARRMLDVAVVMPLLAGADARDPLSRNDPTPDYPQKAPVDLTGVRIGICTAMSWVGIDPEIEQIARTAAQILVDRGAELVEIDPPPGTDEILGQEPRLFDVIAGVEAFAGHRERLQQRDLYTPRTLERILAGAAFTPEDYLAALGRRDTWTRQWRELFATHRLDAVAQPTLDQPAPRVDPDRPPRGPGIRLSMPWSLAGFPALSVPAGLDSRSLPVGFSLAALPEREAQLVGLGIVIDEAVRLWRSPPSDHHRADARAPA